MVLDGDDEEDDIEVWCLRGSREKDGGGGSETFFLYIEVAPYGVGLTRSEFGSLLGCLCQPLRVQFSWLRLT